MVATVGKILLTIKSEEN